VGNTEGIRVTGHTILLVAVKATSNLTTASVQAQASRSIGLFTTLPLCSPSWLPTSWRTGSSLQHVIGIVIGVSPGRGWSGHPCRTRACWQTQTRSTERKRLSVHSQRFGVRKNDSAVVRMEFQKNLMVRLTNSAKNSQITKQSSCTDDFEPSLRFYRVESNIAA
jgi:hypothetical protein